MGDEKALDYGAIFRADLERLEGDNEGQLIENVQVLSKELRPSQIHLECTETHPWKEGRPVCYHAVSASLLARGDTAQNPVIFVQSVGHIDQVHPCSSKVRVVVQKH